MPKLGLGVNLANSARIIPQLFVPETLYQDSLIAYPNAGYSFVNRQWFSGASSANIGYGTGFVRQIVGTNGRHCLTHFNCDSPYYTLYDNGFAYGLVGDIVYGGIYGNALFQKTGLGAGGGSAGWPPNFLFTPSGTQDANGWTRVHPNQPRVLNIKDELVVSFDLKINSPATALTSGNAFRYGLFKSNQSNAYVNADNLGSSNALFSGYSGFMTTLSSAGNNNHKIFTRTTTSSTNLISTTTGVYTQVQAGTLTNLSADVLYSVVLKIVRVDSTTVQYISTITGGSLEGATTVSYNDSTTGVFWFDTLAVFGLANSCASFDLSNIKVICNRFQNLNNMFSPKLWLKADSGVVTSGSTVTSFNDQSGNNNNAVPISTSGSLYSAPLFVSSSINSKPAVRFATNSVLITNSFYPNRSSWPLTIIAVSKASASNVKQAPETAARYCLFGGRSNQFDFGLTYGRYGITPPNFSVLLGRAFFGSFDIESSAFGENAVGLSVAINDGTTVYNYLNGSLIGTKPSSTYALASLNDGFLSLGGEQFGQGQSVDFFANCDIAEVLVYDRALSTDQLQKIQSYLNTKYAIY